MRAKSFNSQIFLEILCYCFFGALMLYLVNSGKYLSYVTPRMAPYLYFTAIVMLIWAFISFFRMFRPQHKVRSTHCFILAIPILLLILPHNPLDISDISTSYIVGNTFSEQKDKYNMKQNSIEPKEPILPTEPIEDITTDMEIDSSSKDHSIDLPGLDEANKKITVSNDDFGIWLSEIYINIEKYQGYTIEMTGSVFKDPEIFKEDEFVPSRHMMSCCVADLALVGLLCKYEKASQLEQDSWVTVEGTLSIRQAEYHGEKYDEPQIQVTKIVPAETVEGFVYPY